MLRLLTTVICLMLVALTTAQAQAVLYRADQAIYKDVPVFSRAQRPSQRSTAVAVDILSQLGAVKGYSDSTFRPAESINRAEFISIAMHFSSGTSPVIHLRCFRDVLPDAWYRQAVCRAQQQGIVLGIDSVGQPAVQRRFEPERPVRYEEALKMLVEVFENTPVLPEPGPWYQPYLTFARQAGIDLPHRVPGDVLSRSDAARLIAAFFAFSRGELTVLRTAERGTLQQTATAKPQPVAEAVINRPRSSVASIPQPLPSIVSYDTHPVTDFRSDFLLAGAVSPVLGSAKIFLPQEPFVLETITVRFVAPAPSVESLFLYDGSRRLLGAAHQDSASSSFILVLPKGAVTFGKGAEFFVYVRANLKHFNDGAVSGEAVQIQRIDLTGYGQWSSQEYTRSSTGDFRPYRVARSKFLSIQNAGAPEQALFAGGRQTLGEFTFAGTLNDATAELAVTAVQFDVSLGGVTVTNLSLEQSDVSLQHPCSLAGSHITCSAIPAAIGSMRAGARTLRLTGDIVIDSGVTKPRLQVSIGQAGSPLTPGSVHWTDGTTTFSWVQFPVPVVVGTVYSY